MVGCIVQHRQIFLFFGYMAGGVQAVASRAQTSAEGKRILIADDSELVRRITRRFLEIGFTVCGEAKDGGDAVEKATQLKPDLIVLDLAMPDMNGAEAASVLKGRMPNVPIVMFSMYSDYVGQTLLSALGVKAIISKPDGIHKLTDCIRNLLSTQSPPAAEQRTSAA